jgi:glycosyltransferase involved in cell wall biosynthesis
MRNGKSRTYCLYLADLRRTATDSQGIVNYALGLAASLPGALSDTERLVLDVNRELLPELPNDLAANCTVRVHPTPRSIAGRLWSDHVGSLTWAVRAGANLVHYPKGYVPLVRLGRSKLVATLHDDISSRYADGHYPGHSGFKTAYFAWATRHALAAADHVITVSDFSRHRLSELAHAHRLGAPPISVSHEGSSLPQLPPVPLDRKEPYLVHLGSRFPHKRSSEAIEMALRFVEEHRPDLTLLVIGRLDRSVGSLTAHPRLRLATGVLSNQELANLISRGRALVFSSEYEGFGLPPVEAYSLGTPAVYPLAAAMPEVMAGAPGGYRLGDYQSFAGSLEEVLSLPDERLLELKVSFLSRYAWSAVARRTLDVYRTVAAE